MFDIFVLEIFASQALDSGKAVSIDNKIMCKFR